MSKIAILSAALVSVGFGIQSAVTEAEALVSRLPRSKAPNVGKPATRKGTDGQLAGEPCSERIIAYARSRKGNVFSLASLALSLGNDRNYISTNLTTLVKRGVLNRTGRGEYVLVKK